MKSAFSSSTSNSRVLVERVIVPRRRPYNDRVRFGSGVDFGSDGVALVEIRDDDGQIVKMLTWFSGYRRPACGVRGFGHVYAPARLQISWSGGFESRSLQRGGRLSASSLQLHAEEIDRHFGSGTTRLIDLRKTLVISDG